MKKILLVEDDESLGFVIKDNLSLAAYDIVWCKDGESALQCFQKNYFDLCLLDIMLPKKDGFQLAEEIRKSNKEIPILFLTAKSMLEDKLEGFNKGGDDYITKPFSMDELLMRISVFLKRRSVVLNSRPQHPIGQFIFDYENLLLEHKNLTKKLTQKEADILLLFCEHENEVLKREFILKNIWGTDDYFLGRSMDVFISKLRKYLKADPAINIYNYHGIGFKLEVGGNDSPS